MSESANWSTRNRKNLPAMQILLYRGHEEPFEARVSRTVL